MKDASPKAAFKREVWQWARRLDIDVKAVAVRAMRNKWASCSTEGNLTFNSELLAFDERVRSYVIVHELLHFFVPNHGRLWKSLMRAHLGEYEVLDARLRQTYTAELAARFQDEEG
jgi:predicted metal-dependent hydrolase